MANGRIVTSRIFFSPLSLHIVRFFFHLSSVRVSSSPASAGCVMRANQQRETKKEEAQKTCVLLFLRSCLLRVLSLLVHSLLRFSLIFKVRNCVLCVSVSLPLLLYTHLCFLRPLRFICTSNTLAHKTKSKHKTHYSAECGRYIYIRDVVRCVYTFFLCDASTADGYLLATRCSWARDARCDGEAQTPTPGGTPRKLQYGVECLCTNSFSTPSLAPFSASPST